MIGDVKGPSGHHRCCHRGPQAGRGRPHLRHLESWVSKLVARYRVEGETALEPKSRRPKTSPTAISDQTADLIVQLRKDLAGQGLDAGPDTIRWHLTQHHDITVSSATISRYLTRAGLVTPEPKKRPRASYLRFQAAMPNETWQSDFTHYPLTDTTAFPDGVEIISWLDDCTRYALHVTRPRRTARFGAYSSIAGWHFRTFSAEPSRPGAGHRQPR